MRRRVSKRSNGYGACRARNSKNKRLISEHAERLIEVTLLTFPKMTRGELFSHDRNLDAAAARSMIYAALYYGFLQRKGMPDIARHFKFSKVAVWSGIKRAQQAASLETVDWYGRRLRIIAVAAQVPFEKFKD